MQDVLPEGGVIRKLWVGGSAKYRDHMLRLDSDSRNSRFAGGVSGHFIRKYADLSQSLDAVDPRLFLSRNAARAASCAAGRALSAPGGSRDQHEKHGQSHGVGSALLRHQLPLRAIAASGSCTWRAWPRTGACSNWRANSTPSCSFDFGSVIGEVESSRPTPLSLMREVMADGHGFATAMLDLRQNAAGVI